MFLFYAKLKKGILKKSENMLSLKFRISYFRSTHLTPYLTAFPK